jgi:adenylate cyclase
MEELKAGMNQVLIISEGSVRGIIRITAQLVDTHAGTQLWAERYDRQLAGPFALQDEVTRNIVKAMEIRLTPREEQILGRAHTENFEAYDLFLQGQKLFKEHTLESNKAAQAAYRRAFELDPNFLPTVR